MKSMQIHMQGFQKLRAGLLPHNTDETSSSAACVPHGLDDVASTPLSEPTSSLHDDGLPFDRGK